MSDFGTEISTKKFHLICYMILENLIAFCFLKCIFHELCTKASFSKVFDLSLMDSARGLSDYANENLKILEKF